MRRVFLLFALAAAALLVAVTGAAAGERWPFFGSTPDMVRVPAGSFFMGCNPKLDAACQEDEKPGRRVVLDAYWIDVTEVTVRHYGLCAGAGACSEPRSEEGCNWGREGREDHPINCVDWHQAEAYCKWAGKRLPTEAEWEKAARGTAGRTHPWGEEETSCGRVVMAEGKSGCGRQSTWPVCSKKAGNSPYGLCDVLGNVWEWVSDWYAEDAYLQGGGKNPRGPGEGKLRAERGGSYYGVARYLRVSNRDRDRPTTRDDAIGFRCAASLEKIR